VCDKKERVIEREEKERERKEKESERRKRASERRKRGRVNLVFTLKNIKCCGLVRFHNGRSLYATTFVNSAPALAWAVPAVSPS
jgi:hypothetical protein